MKLAVALIGTGRLATALAPALAKAGVQVVSVVARTEASARKFGQRFPRLAEVTGTTVGGRPNLFLLAVPDREITATAARLAGQPAPARSVALHHAGGIDHRALEPLQSAGMATGVLHPLQVMGIAGSFLLNGCYARIDGEPGARRVAHRVAAALGMIPLKFRRRPDPEALAAYHAGAALVSNDLVALISMGADLLVEAGIGRKQALDALAVLAEGAVRNVREGGIKGALTGPVARGDHRTVAAHLERLGKVTPEAREIHRLLSRRILELGRPLAAGEHLRMERTLARGRRR